MEPGRGDAAQAQTHPAFPLLLADGLLIKQQLQNYPDGAPFKHKLQGPLLIARLLSQSQPRMMQQVHWLPLPAALVCSASRARCSQQGLGALWHHVLHFLSWPLALRPLDMLPLQKDSYKV